MRCAVRSRSWLYYPLRSKASLGSSSSSDQATSHCPTYWYSLIGMSPSRNSFQPCPSSCQSLLSFSCRSTCWCSSYLRCFCSIIGSRVGKLSWSGSPGSLASARRKLGTEEASAQLFHHLPRQRPSFRASSSPSFLPWKIWQIICP